MQAIVLAATHDTRRDEFGRDVPMPLVDVLGEKYLTTLVRRLLQVGGLKEIHVVTNEAIREQLEQWRRDLPEFETPVTVSSDGTKEPDDRLGAVGDLIFVIRKQKIDDDLIIVGGDNWFTYDLADFLEAARKHPAAVIVAPVTGGTRPSRFGWVTTDGEGRIVEFSEHPMSEQDAAALKASCVYYLDRSSVRWLDTFSQEHTTVCSPGTFFSWLSKKIPVQAVLEKSFWDAGAEQPEGTMLGPDYLEWRDVIRIAANPTLSTWERTAARRMEHVSSHKELIQCLLEGDPNEQIVAARLLGYSERLLSDQAKADVIDALCKALENGSPNEIDRAGSSEDDEDHVVFVSATAADSLVRLGYAPDSESVFQRAAAEGISVRRLRNSW